MSEAFVQHEHAGVVGHVEAEMRGLRLHIDQRGDVATIAETLFAASDAGYNTIIVDTFFDAATVFLSPAMRRMRLTPQHPALRRSDVLDVVCREARELELSVYASMDLRIYHPRGSRTWLHLVSHREIAPTRTGDGLHLCPARPAVRRWLGDIATNICESYPIDGLVISLPPAAMSPCSCQGCKRGRDATSTENYWSDVLLQFCSHLKARARKAHPLLNVALQVDLPQPFVMPTALDHIIDEQLITTFLWNIEEKHFGAKFDLPIALIDSPYFNVFGLPLEEVAQRDPALIKRLRNIGGGIVDMTPDIDPAIADPLFEPEAAPIERSPVASAIQTLLAAAVACTGDFVMRSALLARVDALQVKNLTVDVITSVYDEIAVLAESLRNGPPDTAGQIRLRLIAANRMLMLASA